uniref:Uncharacterized protein n=1 Tax=Pseudo-nitzschia australis TaxID=44445 RepID=A0A7S4ASL1_9STRA
MRIQTGTEKVEEAWNLESKSTIVAVSQQQQQPRMESGRTRTILVTLLVTLGCLAVLHLDSKNVRFFHTASLATLHKTAFDEGSSYGGDDDSWHQHKPKVVILAGPHKTASTTLQDFSFRLAGQSIRLGNGGNGNDTPSSPGSERRPHPSNHKWIWPVTVRAELKAVLGESWIPRKPSKGYAGLAAFVTRRRMNIYYPELMKLLKTGRRKDRLNYLASVESYYQSLFCKVWEDGSNILIGAEAFDAVVRRLTKDDGYETDGVTLKVGEAVHVPPDSDENIQRLLRLFQWSTGCTTTENDSTANTATATTTATAITTNNGNRRDTPPRPPPRLQDLEVHVNLRTPRINHIQSIWRQLGGNATLQTFLLNSDSLYQVNSLALALQFARKGIKTTIVDMQGVFEKEKQQQKANAANSIYFTTMPNGTTIVGGLRGIVACDILQIGSDKDDINDNDHVGKQIDSDSLWCDQHSWLHMPPPALQFENKNKKGNRAPQNITREQLLQIDSALDKYDCQVWKYLQPYLSEGTLRILHPSEQLFSKCDVGTDSNDNGNGKQALNANVSFRETYLKIREIIEIA